MSRAKVRRMPVVNRDKRLVGIVALGDLAVESQTVPPGGAGPLRRVGAGGTIRAEPFRRSRRGRGAALARRGPSPPLAAPDGAGRIRNWPA